MFASSSFGQQWHRRSRCWNSHRDSSSYALHNTKCFQPVRVPPLTRTVNGDANHHEAHHVGVKYFQPVTLLCTTKTPYYNSPLLQFFPTIVFNF